MHLSHSPYRFVFLRRELNRFPDEKLWTIYCAIRRTTLSSRHGKRDALVTSIVDALEQVAKSIAVEQGPPAEGWLAYETRLAQDLDGLYRRCLRQLLEQELEPSCLAVN